MLREWLQETLSWTVTVIRVELGFADLAVCLAMVAVIVAISRKQSSSQQATEAPQAEGDTELALSFYCSVQQSKGSPTVLCFGCPLFVGDGHLFHEPWPELLSCAFAGAYAQFVRRGGLKQSTANKWLASRSSEVRSVPRSQPGWEMQRTKRKSAAGSTLLPHQRTGVRLASTPCVISRPGQDPINEKDKASRCNPPLARVLHAVFGMDHYPRYLLKWDDDALAELQGYLEDHLRQVKEARHQVAHVSSLYRRFVPSIRESLPHEDIFDDAFLKVGCTALFAGAFTSSAAG